MSVTSTIWLDLSFNNSSKFHYASAPGVAAGSASEAWVVAGTFLFTAAIPGTSGGLIQNFDEGNNRGWRMHYSQTAGETVLMADIGLSDGSLGTLSGSNHKAFVGQAFNVFLEINGSVADLYVNGSLLDSLSFGPLTYAPAVGASLELPARTGFPANSPRGLSVLGAGYAETALGSGGASKAAFLHMSSRNYAKLIHFFNTFGEDFSFPYTCAWDTRSLLQAGVGVQDLGFTVQMSPPDTWESVPTALDPKSLSLVSDPGAIRTMFTLDTIQWWQPSDVNGGV